MHVAAVFLFLFGASALPCADYDAESNCTAVTNCTWVPYCTRKSTVADCSSNCSGSECALLPLPVLDPACPNSTCRDTCQDYKDEASCSASGTCEFLGSCFISFNPCLAATAQACIAIPSCMWMERTTTFCGDSVISRGCSPCNFPDFDEGVAGRVGSTCYWPSGGGVSAISINFLAFAANSQCPPLRTLSAAELDNATAAYATAHVMPSRKPNTTMTCTVNANNNNTNNNNSDSNNTNTADSVLPSLALLALAALA